MTPIRLVMFDCDGTLVDSRGLIVATMAAAYRQCDLDGPDPDAVKKVIGLSLPVAIARLQPDAEPGLLREIEATYKRAFLDLRSDPVHREPLYPGVREAIAELRRNGYLLGIATGKGMRGLTTTLDAHGLGDDFVTLQTADQHPSKPHPAMLEAAMAQTGATPQETVMIGDAPFDMEMARACGSFAIGCAWSDHGGASLVAAGADRLIDDYAALAGILAGLRRAA